VIPPAGSSSAVAVRSAYPGPCVQPEGGPDLARLTRLPVDAFERGRGPEICFLSGEHTADRINVRAENPDTFVWLILFGIVPYVVVRALTRRSAKGSLALSEAVYREVKARRVSWVVPAAPLVGGVVIGTLLASRVPAVGWTLIILGLVAAAVLSVVRWRRNPLSGIELDAAGRWVIIPNAADAYADAIELDLRAGRL